MNNFGKIMSENINGKWSIFMRDHKLVFIGFAIFSMLLFGSCSYFEPQNGISARYGILDMTQWEVEDGKNIDLNGEWEFYWKKLLGNTDLSSEKPDLWAQVPSTWSSYKLGGKNLPGEGYGTYRLHVKTDLPANTLMGLRIYSFSSAYKLYINDKCISTAGNVATAPQKEKGSYKPKAVVFSLPAGDFDIIVQVSNYHYARGGFWYKMTLGSAEGIIDLNGLLFGKEVAVGGILVILFLFYLTVYILRRELKYSLYFALVCLDAILAMDMLGQGILLRFIPNISLKAVITLWYSSTTWLLVFLILYIHELFKSKFSSVILKVYLSGAVISQLAYLFTPTTFFTRYAMLGNTYETIGTLSVVVMIAIGIKKGQRDGWLNIVGAVTVSITYIHDNLYWMNMINSSFGELFYAGLFLVLFIQMVIQAQRIKNIDEKRSAAELSFLQAQIKPHFLYNTLNTIISISRYDIEKTREHLYSFSSYLRRSFDFKDLSQYASLKNELELAKAYVEIEKARFEERINVNFHIPEDMDKFNYQVPRLVLQPIIENAIIHGVLPKKGNGEIDVSIVREGRGLIFKVKDDGVGMDLTGNNIANKMKTERGVGLSNVDMRLKKLYGRGLHIDSALNSGTEITWHIQLNKMER